MATSIVYKQLDFGSFETRFLRVVDPLGDPSEPACFNLLTASLVNAPEYNALSYCWGDISKTEAIEVDGITVSVSQSLVEALRHSGTKPGELIWADAICINQSDPYEKTNQIRIMGVIYSKAARTIAWLGRCGAYSKEAFRFLEALSAPGGSVSFSNLFRSQERPMPVFLGLQEIIQRPYWERAWIIQEISKSTNLAILYGEYQFNLDELLKVARHLKDLPQRNRDIMAAIAKFRSQEQRSRVGNPRISLLQALLESRHSRATDQRDKVYTLLGVTSDGSDIVPLPSYTDSIETVFGNLTAAFLAMKRSTNILLLARWAPLHLRLPHAPPWAIDWADLGNSLPPWMMSEAPLEEQKPSGIELPIRDLRIPSMGRYIGTIRQIEGHQLGGEDEAISSRMPHHEEAWRVMARLRNNLINAVTPKSVLKHCEPSYLSSGLARMLRDAMRGQRSEKYNFNATRDILRRLGSLTRDRFRFDQWGNSYDSYVRTSRSSKFNFSDASRRWEDALARIDNLLVFGNRLATIRNGFVFVVGSKAEVGDKVYQVDHVSLPVILRKSSSGEFLIVGEACLGLNSDLCGWMPAIDWLRSPSCFWAGDKETVTSKPIVLDLQNQTCMASWYS
ncbi:heterokaryon incompatibility protein-domain-containing protein [Hypomontagnella submonticulosa]|nr:heterokaryon incompatibility protein-domain-containing protein [Hypomontagnella submonticulosa]